MRHTLSNPVRKGIPMPSYQPVLDFWFSDTARPYWFQNSDDFDQTIRTQFAAVFQAALANHLAH